MQMGESNSKDVCLCSVCHRNLHVARRSACVRPIVSLAMTFTQGNRTIACIPSGTFLVSTLRATIAVASNLLAMAANLLVKLVNSWSWPEVKEKSRDVLWLVLTNMSGAIGWTSPHAEQTKI